MDNSLIERVQMVGITNAYTLSKKTEGKVILREFDPANESHLGLLDTLITAQMFFPEWKFYIECSLRDLWRTRRRVHWRLIYRLSKRSAQSTSEWPTTDEFIAHIETANEAEGAFAQYFREGK